MPYSNGKKSRGHYYNGLHYHRQSHKLFRPGTKVVEKRSGDTYTVLPKYDKSHRTLIRVERDSDMSIKYIRCNLLHTENYSKILLNKICNKTTYDNVKKEKVFKKNISLNRFKKYKREFNDMLKPHNSVTNIGGGVSIDYSKDSKGEFYIHSISGNDMIDGFNKQNLKIMNYLYKTLNDPKKMTVREHIIPRSRILEIFMRDSSGSTMNLIPDCCSKSDYYSILNRYIDSVSDKSSDDVSDDVSDNSVSSKKVSDNSVSSKKVFKFTDEYIKKKKWGLC